MQKATDNIALLVVAVMLGVFILVISFLFLLFRSQQKLLAEKNRLQQAEIDHQKELLRAVIESQEAERKRIGRDLHDGIASSLTNLRITVGHIGNSTPIDGFSEQLIASSKSLIDGMITDIRNISHNLSPEILTIQTLTEAIEELCFIVDQASGIAVFVTNNAGKKADMPDHTASLAIYRILEELLANTIKHAQAASIHICLAIENNKLLFDYRDDGIGLPDVPFSKKGRGLQNIESRLNIIQASCTVEPKPGQGFHIQFTVPLPSN
jgi:signal transduction histidine kinase